MDLSPGSFFVDLDFRGCPGTIATLVLHGADGVALVDPGPTPCLPVLEAGLLARGVRLSDVTDILVTHIHLDHSGSVGVILRAHPRIRVWVHERGLPHIADPAKLVDSATRLYGEEMGRLWGEIAGVPFENLRSLAGGERIVAAGRALEVAYTPGHASHHVSYFDADSRTAMVGDVAGVCIAGGFVLPPTPPPDIDVDAWTESVARIERWSPERLFITHFGPVAEPAAHLRSLVANLGMTAAWAEASLAETGTDEERARRFADRLMRHMQEHANGADLACYPVAVPFEHLWPGLARYLRKKRAS